MGIINFIKHKIPVVFIVHEIQFVKYKREAFICQNSGNTQKMADNLKLSKKYEKYELNELSKYDAVLTLSKIDKNILQSKKITSKVFESTLGIDISKIEKLQHNYFDKLVFIGNGAHFPNLDALLFYKDEILPLLNKVLPNINLYVTGKYEQSFIDRFNDVPNIIWCGFVDSLNELLLNSISIVPVRIGSGIRIKILEAMARGCPVVSTEIGIEGIDVVNGKHAIIANDAENFVNGIYSIVSQKSLASEMSVMSRTFVEENYNVQLNVAKRMNIFEKAIK
jgi:glycosyltransferase involved in cell wall biosynthesis